MKYIILFFMFTFSIFCHEYEIIRNGKVAAKVVYNSDSESCYLIYKDKELLISRTNGQIQYQYIIDQKVLFTLPVIAPRARENKDKVKHITPSQTAQGIAIESATRILDHLKNNSVLSSAAEYQILSMLYVSADKYEETHPFKLVMPKCNSFTFDSGYGETKSFHFYEPKKNHGLKTKVIFGQGTFSSYYEYVWLDYAERSTFELGVVNYRTGQKELHLRKIEYDNDVGDFEAEKVFDLGFMHTPIDIDIEGTLIGNRYSITRPKSVELNYESAALVTLIDSVYEQQKLVEAPYEVVVEILKQQNVHSADENIHVEIEENPETSMLSLQLEEKRGKDIGDANKLRENLEKLFTLATKITVLQ